jgi:hypothetical protein
VAQQRSHVVHLAVARAGVGAAAVDLLHDHARLGEAEARAAVVVRDQRGEPARLRERVDEGLRIGALRVDLAVVAVGETARTARARRRAGPGSGRARLSAWPHSRPAAVRRPRRSPASPGRLRGCAPRARSGARRRRGRRPRTDAGRRAG